MADFFTDLWTSVFTPGATPTLLVATNVSFAALQLLLLSLLLVTYSVHFGILSVLCAGLWWSINWFAREVSALKEEEQQRLKADKSAGVASASGSQSAAIDGGTAADSEDTETEELVQKSKGLRQRPTASTAAARAAAAADLGADDTDMSASTGGLSVHSIDSRKRTSTGNVSGTDSEWDKLDSEVE